MCSTLGFTPGASLLDKMGELGLDMKLGRKGCCCCLSTGEVDRGVDAGTGVFVGSAIAAGCEKELSLPAVKNGYSENRRTAFFPFPPSESFFFTLLGGAKVNQMIVGTIMPHNGLERCQQGG